jgi:hypothetical protein
VYALHEDAMGAAASAPPPPRLNMTPTPSPPPLLRDTQPVARLHTVAATWQAGASAVAAAVSPRPSLCALCRRFTSLQCLRAGPHALDPLPPRLQCTTTVYITTMVFINHS